MILALRAFFLSRLLREKLLLVAFIAIGAVIWLSSFSTRAGVFWRAQAATTRDLRDQDRWLKDRPRVEAMAQHAASRLKPEQTLDATRLFTTVRQLALDAGLRNLRSDGAVGGGATSNGQFSVNTIGITIQANDPDAAKNWSAIRKFYYDLQQRSPYIAIDQFTLQSNRANPGQLTLVLRVSSVEIH